MIGDLFAYLQQALGYILSFFYDLWTPLFSDGVGYGLAIICLTITINLVVFPLTLKQTRATRAFTEIQPKIKKIQAEYKDDPQEMQRRLMEAQKEAGATPGGCLLPMLVQMPIWFALFRILRTPIVYELAADAEGKTINPQQYVLDSSGHPVIDGTAIQHVDPLSNLGKALDGLGGFIEQGSNLVTDWIPGKDMGTFLGMNLGISPSRAMSVGIAAALPYLVMIGIMVATQYVQQWHSTYGQDRPDQKGAGTQQAITRIMPLFIGFVSWNFPAGLVLYWATSNLFRLGQQAVIFKIDGRPTSPAAAKESPEKTDSEGTAAKKPQTGAASKRRRRRRK